MASLLGTVFGFTTSYANLSGKIGEDSYHVRTFEFTAGIHTIYAEGTRRNCDLDLKIYDEAGSLVASDTLDHNEPQVQISVTHPAVYDLVFENYGPSQRYSGYIRSR